MPSRRWRLKNDPFQFDHQIQNPSRLRIIIKDTISMPIGFYETVPVLNSNSVALVEGHCILHQIIIKLSSSLVHCVNHASYFCSVQPANGPRGSRGIDTDNIVCATRLLAFKHVEHINKNIQRSAKEFFLGCVTRPLHPKASHAT